MEITKVNDFYSKLKFKNQYSTSMDSRDAGLMIQSSYAALNFSREKYLAEQAGSIDTNPIKALGYKLYRTFGYLTNHETPISNRKIDTVA